MPARSKNSRDYDLSGPLTPVSGNYITQEYQKGALVEKVVIQRIEGRHRVVVFPVNSSEGLVIGKMRGGVRYWKDIKWAVAWVEENLPEVLDIELRLDKPQD